MAPPARPSDPSLSSASLPGRYHGILAPWVDRRAQPPATPSRDSVATATGRDQQDTASDVRYERMNAGDLVADRFEIEKLAATGGMGDVYRARDRRTAEVVALKVLHGPGARYAAVFGRLTTTS